MDQTIIYNNSIVSLSNKELQNRLRKMMFSSIPANRDDLINMYTNALQNSSKKQLIQSELEQDNQFKHNHLKRQNIISYFQQAKVPNDKTYKMDPCQICNNDNKENIIYFEKISLRKKKKNKDIRLIKNNNDNNHNIQVITQNRNENNFVKTPEKQENMLRDRLNIYDMINNKNKQNILSDEPTPMNFFVDKNDDKPIKNNANLTNNYVINNIHFQNINAKRNSLSKNKYHQPVKTRRTISNPKELTPISERNSFFENMSSRIGNSTNITSNDTSNISNLKFSSPSQLHLNDSSSPETPKSFYLEDNSFQHQLHFPSKNYYNILLLSFPVVSCGVLFYLYNKHRENINKNISPSLDNLHTMIKEIIEKCPSNIKLFWEEITKNYLGYIVCLGIIGVGLWFLYSKYKEKKTVKEMFEEIKAELKEMMIYKNDDIIENNSEFGYGMSEKEIIKKYSKKYKIKEDKFIKKYFPQLKEKRKKDINLKEFEEIINGVSQRIWQFST